MSISIGFGPRGGWEKIREGVDEGAIGREIRLEAIFSRRTMVERARRGNSKAIVACFKLSGLFGVNGEKLKYVF